MNPNATVSFVLAKNEVDVYKTLCREAEVPPDRYVSGRKVECPLFHIIDLLIQFAEVGADMTGEHYAGPDMYDGIREWLNLSEGIVDKAVTACVQEGVMDDLQALYEDDPRLGEDVLQELSG